MYISVVVNDCVGPHPSSISNNNSMEYGHFTRSNSRRIGFHRKIHIKCVVGESRSRVSLTRVTLLTWRKVHYRSCKQETCCNSPREGALIYISPQTPKTPRGFLTRTTKKILNPIGKIDLFIKLCQGLVPFLCLGFPARGAGRIRTQKSVKSVKALFFWDETSL